MEANKVMLTQSVEYGNDPEAPIKLAMLESQIDEANYKASIYSTIRLTDAEMVEQDNAWLTYRERTASL